VLPRQLRLAGDILRQVLAFRETWRTGGVQPPKIRADSMASLYLPIRLATPMSWILWVMAVSTDNLSWARHRYLPRALPERPAFDRPKNADC
jgi:hypothetical protein